MSILQNIQVGIAAFCLIIFLHLPLMAIELDVYDVPRATLKEIAWRNALSLGQLKKELHLPAHVRGIDFGLGMELSPMNGLVKVFKGVL